MPSRLEILAFALAAAGALRPGIVEAQQGRDESTFSWSKELPSGSLLTIANGDGPITVREASGNAVLVRAVKNPRSRGSIRDVAFGIEETSGGRQVDICTLYDRQTSCHDHGGSHNVRVSVEYTISIPRSMRLRVTTGNGEISVERAGADVVATTGNGNVFVGETSGEVRVTTGNGTIQVQSADGPVRANTGTGRISILTGHGAVDANSGAGDIDVRVKSSPIDDDMHFTSGAGSIHVTLPSDFNGRVDASSGFGSLRSDFEIAVVGRFNAQHVRGTIGRGGPLIRMVTGAGSIELRKN